MLLILLVLGPAIGAIFLLPMLGIELPEPVAGWVGGGAEPSPTRRDEADTPTAEPEQTIAPSATSRGSVIADLPTVTPFPTGTPRPTLTPLPPGMTASTDAPLQPGAAPATPIPPTPTLPAGAFTLAGASGVVAINQPWEQDGVTLTARTIDIRSQEDGDAAAARVWFRLINKTGERILIEIDWNNIHLEDSFGTRYVDYSGGGTTSEWIEPGANFDFDRHYTTIVEQPSRVPGNAAFVQVVVDSFSRVQNARWQFDINPALTPISPPPAGESKAVGEVWEKNGLTLQLADLRIHDDQNGDAAARAWFALTNATNQEILVDIDFGRIYLLDSFGRRFGDWDGGGLMTQTIGPGQTIEFDRSYSEMSGRFSRITRGATFVTLVVDNTAGQGTALWTFEIDSRLSGSAPVAPLAINQPWEQDGISLTARAIEIRGQDDGDAAAARVWYRLVNKTGQWLLVDIDWSTLHLEDSFGTVYGDYYGQELTSFWIRPGAIHDFDRYYSAIVEQESRIPADTRSVTIIVDAFSRIKNARWQRTMAPELVAQDPPDDSQALAIGDGWEQDGLMLRLTDLEVRSESDGAAAAFRAWYELVNTTSRPILVEIDYGYLSVTDSFGGRFGDWDGGGLTTRWIGPGESLEFDRHYSEMAGQAGRIARGSAFVLVRFNNEAGIPSGIWRMDITR